MLHEKYANIYRVVSAYYNNRIESEMKLDVFHCKKMGVLWQEGEMADFDSEGMNNED